MALARCARVMPMVARRVSFPGVQQVRNFLFDPWSRSSDIRALMRDMDRQMDRLEREMFQGFPRSVPSLIPATFDYTTNPSEGGQYRIAVNLSGFKPEEIDLSLDESGRKLTIKAHCQRSGKDGSRFSQEVTRVVTLPESIDTNQLKSMLHNDGYLAVEAPFKEQQQEEPKQIPIGKQSEKSVDQIQQQEVSSSLPSN